MADGGEGTLDVLEKHLSIDHISLTVNDPLFRPVKAFYYKNKNTAFIEMAVASGLQLLKENERNPLYTTTFGTGELILDAIKKECKKIYLFVGGSATNEAGMGMAAALGYRFINKNDQLVSPIGKNLIGIDKIENSDLLFNPNKLEITVACDVQNILFGKNGAAYIYAPQKGADNSAVELLDNGLRHISQKIKNYLQTDISKIEGGGAAGGIAAGAVAFFNAKIKSGVESVMEASGFYQQLDGVDLVITGEGKMDHQTPQGKVIKGVADVCRERGIPIAVLCGVSTLDKNDLGKMGIQHCLQLVSENILPENAMANAAELLEKRAFELMKLLQ